LLTCGNKDPGGWIIVANEKSPSFGKNPVRKPFLKIELHNPFRDRFKQFFRKGLMLIRGVEASLGIPLTWG